MREDVQIAMGIKYKVPVGMCIWCKGLKASGKYCAYHQWLYKNMTRMMYEKKN